MYQAVYVFFRAFLLLMIYSFFGWAYESALCSITEKRPVNRGFLTGPVCPVYGFGILTVISVVGGVEPVVPLFLCSSVVTCAVEYFTAWLLETLFDAKWWDYSDRRFNLHGRVCLIGAVVFGLLSVLAVKVIHPAVTGFVDGFGRGTVILVSAGLMVLFAVDLFETVRSLLSMKNRMAELQAALEKYKADLDWGSQQLKALVEQGRAELQLKSELAAEELRLALEERETTRRSRLEELRQRVALRFEESEFNTSAIQRLREKRSWQEKRLLRAFPRMRPNRYGEAAEQLRRWLEEKKKKQD